MGNNNNNYILEITLISAQELKKTTTFRRMKTYAVVWIDSDTKLKTSVDKIGGQNPTWNDKFLFKVPSEFLYSETSGISIKIFDDGIIRDNLVGTVRFLVGNVLRAGSSYVTIRTPSFNAVQVRRPSGRFQGVINIGASVLLCSDVPAMREGVSAISFRDLMNETAAKSKSFKRSHSSVGVMSRENRMIKRMEITKHVRSSSEGSVSVSGSGFLPEKAGRNRALTVNKSFNDLKPWNGRSKLAS